MIDRPWPRIYYTTIYDRAAMSPDKLQELYIEYREFWRGHEGHSNPTKQSDYQRDRDEDRFGTYR